MMFCTGLVVMLPLLLGIFASTRLVRIRVLAIHPSTRFFDVHATSPLQIFFWNLGSCFMELMGMLVWKNLSIANPALVFKPSLR